MTSDRPGDPTRALLERLIACASVTPDDAGCCDILAAELVPLGFQAHSFDASGVRNLWLRRGTRAPLFVLAGHCLLYTSPSPRDA